MRTLFALLLLSLLVPLLPGQEFEISLDRQRAVLFQGERLDCTLTLQNRGKTLWRSEEGYALSYHLLSKDRSRVLFFENLRFPLPGEVPSRSRRTFNIQLFFTAPPGEYVVQLDLVKEGAFWASQKGGRVATFRLLLKPLLGEEFRRLYLNSHFRGGSFLLEKDQYVVRMVYRNGEVRRGGRLVGFTPGTSYPQFWIRDTATALGTAKLFYPWEDLASLMERFLSSQDPSGEVADWVDLAGKRGKNNVETDQESSLVLGAYEVSLERPEWLKRRVAGQRVFSRLDKALEWVWTRKRDTSSGLVVSGYTADWGDVERSYPDQRAIRLSDRSLLVLSLYTNSKYLQAVEKMVLIAERAGEPTLASKWRGREGFLRKKIRELLFDRTRGYFRINRKVDPRWEGKWEFLFEREILAVGGNAEALEAGLYERPEAERFVRILEAKRRALRLPTVSYTLLPPYPQGFFPHPLLSAPYHYQNGGEWDWIGGRLIRTLFKKGFSKEAQGYLEALAAKHCKNLSLAEWEDRNGTPRGAYFYVGSAGVVGEALWHGYLGWEEGYGSHGFRGQPPVSSVEYRGEGMAFRWQVPEKKLFLETVVSGKRVRIGKREFSSPGDYPL